MKRSKKEVAAAVERVEAVACTNIGDVERELMLRPNDLRRLVDGLDDARDRDARQAAELRRLRKAVRIGQDELAATCACDPDSNYRCGPHTAILVALKPARRKP